MKQLTAIIIGILCGIFLSWASYPSVVTKTTITLSYGLEQQTLSYAGNKYCYGFEHRLKVPRYTLIIEFPVAPHLEMFITGTTGKGDWLYSWEDGYSYYSKVTESNCGFGLKLEF